jgi:hypothetical protein
VISNEFFEGFAEESRRLRALALCIQTRGDARLVGRIPETQALHIVDLFGVDQANRVDEGQGLR